VRPPKIPGYTVEGAIGRGSTGVVWRARQLAVDREVALKVLHSDLSQNPRVVQRLQREARTTARLAHPHIVSAIDMGETDGVWWYAMELVDGPSLARRLKKDGYLGEREALRLFIPLCEALEHAAEHGVVHRDIKPANILIDAARGARLADLGLAFADDDPSLTGNGGTLGTPHYISPEQARSSADADVRSDLWSFGATLFHAVCGRPPFAGESAAEVLSSVLYARIPDPHRLRPELSRGLALVLRKCLSRDPDARYQTPHELLLDLERVRERRLPKVRRRGLDPVDRGPRRGLRWLSAAASMAAGALAFALITNWLDHRSEAEPEDAAAVTSWPPLEAVANRLGTRQERLFTDYTELLAVEGELPSAFRGRWLQVRTGLKNELREVVGELLREASELVESKRRSEDFRSGLAFLATGLDELLVARTGFVIAELPEESRAVVESRRQFLRRDLESTLSVAAEGLAQSLLRHTEQVIVPDALALQAAGAWRSAAERLTVSDTELLSRVAFHTSGFPEATLDDAMAPARLALFRADQELRAAWSRVDHDLRVWIEERGVTLEREGDGLAPGVGDQLRRSFERELARRGISDGERHPQGLPFAEGELESRATSLERLAELQLRERTLKGLADWDELCRPLWGLREYEAIHSYYEEFRERVLQLPGDASAEWRGELIARCRLRQREAELLTGLLERTAAEIRRLDGSATPLRVGNITRRGTIEVQGDPLVDGFWFTTGRRERVSLRDLPIVELERLAGLDPESSAGRERLIAALVRYHEGEPERGKELLAGDAVDLEGLDGELADELSDRVFAALEDRARDRQGRERVAQMLLDVLERGAEDRASSLRTLSRLLDEYGDLELVRNERERLRSLRDELEAGPAEPVHADFLRVFDLPDRIGEAPTVEFLERNRVRLSFDFRDEAPGTWERGDWLADPAGWSAPGGARELRDWQRRGPRLLLRPPLDLDAGEVTVSLTLSKPGDSGAARLVVISLLDYHFALTGRALGGGEPRWLVGSAGVEELVERLAKGEGEEHSLPLAAGEEHRVELRVHPRRGTVAFRLDDVTLYEGAVRTSRSGYAQLSLRSWEPVTLVDAKVEASY